MRTITSLKAVINDPERKSLPSIFWETIHSGLIERELPIHYFNNLLYKKEADDYRNYIGFKKGYNIINNFYYPNGRNPELENKIQFYEIASKNGIETPRIVAENKGKTICTSNSTYNVNTISKFHQVVSELLQQSRSGMLFVKPFDGLGGRNSFKIFNESCESIEKIFHLMDSHNFIFQEIVVQDDRINKIYSESINTIRIHAYKNKGEVDIVSALMRFGRNGSVVDNISVGGFFIPIDLESWKLKGRGKSFLNQGARTFSVHPDSNIKLDGFELPYKTDVFELVKNATKHFDTNFVGWDVALTPDGPVIIEGNNGPHIFMLQMACRGIKTHPEYKKIFEDYI